MTGPAHFNTTRWSLVLAAGKQDSGAQRALSELCETYWQPVYGFIRRREGNAEVAMDLTQEFFSRLLEKDWVRDADPHRGRFRAFMLTAIRNFLANQHDRDQAQKRGGGRTHVSIDPNCLPPQLATTHTPEREYDRLWGLALLERVLHQLEQRYASQNRAELFAVLRPCLTGEPQTDGYRALAAAVGMSEGAIKVALHRCRRRFAAMLREEIAHTVTSPDEIDAEVRDLFDAFGHP